MINIGLIGCGYISGKHIKTMTRFKEYQLVAVSDLQDQRMEETIQLYRQSKNEQTTITQYKNYQDLLLDSQIDTVIISVISGLHAEIAKQAIMHGKHVIVEKPLALSLHDANELISLASSNQRLILVCHQLRYHPLLTKIKTLIDHNVLGDLYLGSVSIRINRNDAYYASANWRGTWNLDGGMLINQGIHLIDILTWYFGDISSVYGEISNSNHNKETEDIATGIISFKNKAKGIIEANTITKPENLGYYLSIFGKKGTICLGGKKITTVQHCHIDNHPHLEAELKQLSESEEEHYMMYENFLHSIQKKENLLMSAEAGKEALQTIFAIYKSNKQKCPVTIPMVDFATSEMNFLPDIKRKENNL